MIIRKPYAFMIKHFKLIHIILLGLLASLYLTMNNIYKLFVHMVNTNTNIYTGALGYINKYVNFFIFLILVLALLVHMLLKSKKKKPILYMGTVIYMVALFIGFIYINGRLKLIADTALDISKISLYKDISFIMMAPCYPLFAFFILRGLGLNIKQFNFNKDIKDLALSEEDSEEIELTLSNDTYKIFRFIRRFIREMKYYILEHTFVFTLIVLLCVAALTGLGVNYYQENVKANATNVVSMVDGINFSVSKSYLTTKDFNGEVVKKGSKFLIVELGLRNSTMLDKVVDFDRLSLEDGNISYYPTTTYNNRFYDLGLPYEKNSTINSNEMVFRTFIFELPINARTDNFKLKLYSGINIKKRYSAVYKRFAIKPINIDKEAPEKIYKLGETIESNAVNLNKIDFTITKTSFSDNYKYDYVSCKTEGDCRTLQRVIKPQYTNYSTLLVLDYTANIDENANFNKRFNNIIKFMDAYAMIEYSTPTRFIQEKVKISSDYLINGKIILEINREITKSNIINLYLNFRDQKAKISIKGQPEVKLIQNGEFKTYEDLKITNVEGIEKKEEETTTVVSSE